MKIYFIKILFFTFFELYLQRINHQLAIKVILTKY